MNDLDKLKLILREKDLPCFSDEELQFILESSGSFDMAVYSALILKAENTQISLQGYSVNDTHSYFLRLAALYRPTNTGVI